MKDRTLFRLGSLAAWIGTITLVILAMAIDTTDISEADLTLWGVSSLVLMVLGAIGIYEK